MWRRRRSSQDFSDEIQAHLAIETDRLRQDGLSEEEAAFAARRAMGNVMAIQERFYDARHWNWLGQLRQDVLGCLQQWRKRPVVAAIALLTIALGTGMNVALFRIVWNVLLRPLPYPNPNELVQVWQVYKGGGGFTLPASDRLSPQTAIVERWQARSRSFDALASYRGWMATVGSGGDPERVNAALVSAEFFPVLGARTRLGRTFTPAEMQPGTDDAIVLSYNYWKTRFGGDRSLVGKPILIEGEYRRVVGVLTADFFDFSSLQPSVYAPISTPILGRRQLNVYVVGRLRDGVGIEAARSELTALVREPGRAPVRGIPWDGVNITRLQDEAGRALQPALWVLFAATGCILLIACVNVANLLLSQAIGRRQELAIRAAVGAGRGRLVRQLLTEALVLALAGTLLGVGAGWALSRSMEALYQGTLPRAAEGDTAAAVLLFAVAIAILSTAFFGVLPAMLATRGAGDASLKVSRVWMGRGAGRWREVLIGLQVALTATMLVSAGLLLKSLAALHSIDLGFERTGLFTAQVVLPESRYRKPEERARFAARLVDRLKSIPGVSQAAIINSLPLAANLVMSLQFSITGQAEESKAYGRAVVGNYFDALSLRMKEGRPLTAADDGRRDVVVINESFARHYVRTATATGTVLRFGDGWTANIVGVVRDLRSASLKTSAEPEIYMPFSALPNVFLDIVVRTAAPQSAVVAAARSELRSLDPGLALAKVSTMDDVVDSSIAGPRFQAVLLGLFAAVAMALATVGIYGVIVQGVRARTAEFGIRIALGATAPEVFWLVVRRALRAPVAGLALGLVGAWASSRLLESLLYGVKPHDASVVVCSAALVAAVCMASCALPARQACRTDAARTLRDE
ncbi:MAG TPA: ABC transporter permease [Bryobacteraceae bacterium]|nr:ABC transporter permease [Bryobacteraceae bacterium]